MTSFFNPSKNRWVWATIIFVLPLVSGSPVQGQPADDRYALLVGCTEYPNQRGIRELYGPANDVPIWAELLTDPKGFAFPKENVAQFFGWPQDEAKRPTYANIVKGFKNLIAKAKPDSRIVIVLSGHGMQVPIKAGHDPLDPKNPEPDGLDEMFLPADVGEWTEEEGLKNALRDDQVGVFLDQLRARGAHVLIVFDCCHSGTMTRGGEPRKEGLREIDRVADHEVFGITRGEIENAVARAARAVNDAKQAGKEVPGEAVVRERPRGPGKGSLVAFYAAQPFEEAPELPLPEGKPMLKANYYGLLSFTLVQTIRQRQRGLTYGELERLVSAEYRSARATRPPTPFAEGDLNREVLGLTTWPNRSPIYLQRDQDDALRVDAGALHGLTEGSILSVMELGAEKKVLGYVQVKLVTPSSAFVIPVEFDGKPALPANLIKKGAVARCEVVEKDFGDLQVKLFTNCPQVRAALRKLPEEPSAMIKLVDEPEAQWVLRLVTPKQAETDYGIKGLEENEVFLVQGTGQTPDPNKAKPPQKDPKIGEPGSSKYPKVFGRFAKSPAGFSEKQEQALLAALERDLPKIFTWQNVWRVAEGVSAAEDGETHDLELEVVKLKDKFAKDGELLRGGLVESGQELLFRATNEGQHDLWVSAFYLDANLGIQVIYSAGVGRGRTVKLAQGKATVEGESAGREGIVVFAVPQAVTKDPPNFEVIVQEPLDVADQGKGEKGERGPRSPFQRLLAGAAVNKEGRTRKFTPGIASTPAILAQSWVLVP